MSLPATYFQDVFQGSDDPWSFRTRWYEERKRALTLAALPRRSFDRCFEPGCANGELTATLAPRCRSIFATDCATRAVNLARQRVENFAHVEIRCERLPDDWPDGTFDLIVMSEMAYYFDAATLEGIADRIASILRPGGVLLLCHWRHFVADYPLTGDEVHAIVRRRLSLFRVVTHEEDDFVLDVWSTSATSVAQAEGLA